MAIVSGDIIFRLSVKTGSAGDSTAGTPAGSLGKYVSTTAFSGTALNNLFDDVSGAENAASTVDYRCGFVLNNHGSLTLQSPTIYLSSEVAGGTSISIATDNIAVSAKGGASAQAAEITTETTVPSGVSAFSSPTTSGSGLSLGSIAAGSVKGFWAKRTAANTVAVDADGVTFAVTGDTAA